MKQAAIISLLLFTGLLFADTPPKPGTFYKDSELDIRKKEIKNGKIFLTFSPKKERFFWCPGIKIKHTKKATVVTFVRAKASENGEYDLKAKYDRRLLTQQVTIETKNLDTYIRNGEKTFKKIYEAKKKSSSTSKSNNKTKGKTKTQGGSEGSKESSKETKAESDESTEEKSAQSKWFLKNASLLADSTWGGFAEDNMPAPTVLSTSAPNGNFAAGELAPSISKPAKQKMLVNEFVLPAAD